MGEKIAVLLVDDHALLRDSLGERLAREPGIHLVGTVENAERAIEEAIRVRPDVILMDIDMPGLPCFEAAQTIRARCPKAHVVFLSAFFSDAYIEQALAIEAAGYVTKREPIETVVEAVRAAEAGRRYFSPEVRERLVIATDGVYLARKLRSRAATLTPRELEVLRYIARGLTQKEIAQTMHRSSDTVHSHIANLRKKLGIGDRVELTRFAIREGLVEA